MIKDSLIAIQRLKDGGSLFTMRKNMILSHQAKEKIKYLQEKDRCEALTVSFRGAMPFDKIVEEVGKIAIKIKEDSYFTRYDTMPEVGVGSFNNDLHVVLTKLSSSISDEDGATSLVGRVNDMFAEAIPEDMWDELTPTGELNEK